MTAGILAAMAILRARLWWRHRRHRSVGHWWWVLGLGGRTENCSTCGYARQRRPDRDELAGINY